MGAEPEQFLVGGGAEVLLFASFLNGGLFLGGGAGWGLEWWHVGEVDGDGAPRVRGTAGLEAEAGLEEKRWPHTKLTWKWGPKGSRV